MTAEQNLAANSVASPMSSGGRFFTDDDFEFNARMAISKAAQGAFDLGLAVQTLGRIADGDPASWLQEWTRTADQLSRWAAGAERAGHPRTASRWHLAAADAYARAIAFIDALPDDTALRPTFKRHRESWEAFINTSSGRHVRFDVTYEDGTLPGYLLRPDATNTPRPTLVITNGSDGSLSGLWGEGIKAGLERDWNVFVFDGPGQQSLLFEREIPFRHDWEAVLTPVVDALLTRPDIDGRRLVALGISQGGYWLPRGLAFEHRFVAAVVDDGVWDVSRVWYDNLSQPLLDMLHNGERDNFNKAIASGPRNPVQERGFRFRARPYGTFETPYDLFRAVGEYRLEHVVDRIDTPIMVCDPDDEAWFTGQPRELYDALHCEKELAHFSRDDGANLHCEPWGRDLVAAVTCDFLERHLERIED